MTSNGENISVSLETSLNFACMVDVGERVPTGQLFERTRDIDNCECQKVSRGYSNLTVDEEVFSLMTSRPACFGSAFGFFIEARELPITAQPLAVLGGSREEPKNIKFEQFLIFDQFWERSRNAVTAEFRCVPEKRRAC